MQQLDCPQPADGARLPLLTANVESCCSSFAVWHFGHSGFCSPKSMASNLCPHSSQRYSKIGISRSTISQKRSSALLHLSFNGRE